MKLHLLLRIFLVSAILYSSITCDSSQIDIYNGPYEKLATYESSFLLDSLPKEYGVEDVLNVIGKICISNSSQNIINECFTKFENFNYDWVRYSFINM